MPANNRSSQKESLVAARQARIQKYMSTQIELPSSCGGVLTECDTNSPNPVRRQWSKESNGIKDARPLGEDGINIGASSMEPLRGALAYSDTTSTGSSLPSSSRVTPSASGAPSLLPSRRESPKDAADKENQGGYADTVIMGQAVESPPRKRTRKDNKGSSHRAVSQRSKADVIDVDAAEATASPKSKGMASPDGSAKGGKYDGGIEGPWSGDIWSKGKGKDAASWKDLEDAEWESSTGVVLPQTKGKGKGKEDMSQEWGWQDSMEGMDGDWQNKGKGAPMHGMDGGWQNKGKGAPMHGTDGDWHNKGKGSWDGQDGGTLPIMDGESDWGKGKGSWGKDDSMGKGEPQAPSWQESQTNDWGQTASPSWQDTGGKGWEQTSAPSWQDGGGKGWEQTADAAMPQAQQVEGNQWGQSTDAASPPQTGQVSSWEVTQAQGDWGPSWEQPAASQNSWAP